MNFSAEKGKMRLCEVSSISEFGKRLSQALIVVESKDLMNILVTGCTSINLIHSRIRLLQRSYQQKKFDNLVFMFCVLLSVVCFSLYWSRLEAILANSRVRQYLEIEYGVPVV